MPIDTFLSSFIVPILPYMLEDRVGLDYSRTQSVSSWLLTEGAAVSVIVRMPLAHFADKSVSKRNWFLWALVICLGSNIATAFGSSCMSEVTNLVIQWLIPPQSICAVHGPISAGHR